MQRTYSSIYALIMLSIIITVFFLAIMPDQVPMHYNALGQIDRIGSKYENLVFPLVVFLSGALFLALARYFRKKNEPENEQVILRSGIAMLVLFNVLFGYFMWKATSYTPEAELDTTAEGIYQIGSLGLGAALIALASLMPKTSINSVVGLRTGWSMKNERVWQRSQRFGGIAMAICGLAVIISGLFIKGVAGMLVGLGLLLVTALICVLASYRIYVADKNNHNKP
ncbi:MAG: DUF1648 domain-containing protein [Firmicutes bacterium]|nr:DUF1648 domain-containing protein [Bacillota bacterium]